MIRFWETGLDVASPRRAFPLLPGAQDIQERKNRPGPKFTESIGTKFDSTRSALESLLCVEVRADSGGENEAGIAPLHSVSESQVAKVLLDNGAAPSAREGKDRTPLHDMLQIESGKEAKALASLLLERGADPNAQDDNGFTPLVRVAQNNSKVSSKIDEL